MAIIKRYWNRAFFFLVLRFGLVGLFNTALGYSLFLLFTLPFPEMPGQILGLKLRYDVLIATVCSHVLAASVAFFLNRSFTFRSKNKAVNHEFMRYIIVSATQLVLSALLNQLFIAIIGMEEYLGALLTIMLVTMFSFFGHFLISFGSVRARYTSNPNEEVQNGTIL